MKELIKKNARDDEEVAESGGSPCQRDQQCVWQWKFKGIVDSHYIHRYHSCLESF